MKAKTVFLSYARAESTQYAVSLARALHERGIETFLDTSDIDIGDHFLGPMIEALLNSRVAVIFVGPVYFTRPGCLRELEVAQAALDLELASDGSHEVNRESALQHVVVALPPGASLDLVQKHLSWTQAQVARTTTDDTERLADLVARRLSKSKKPIRDRLHDIDVALVRERAVRIPDVDSRSTDWMEDERRWYHPSAAAPLVHAAELVGRGDELFKLRNLLTSCRHQPGRNGVSLSGRPGAGKTRLVEEYVRRFGSEWSAVFWIDASSDALGIGQQHYDIAVRLLRLIDGPAAVMPSMADVQARGISFTDCLAQILERIRPDSRLLLVLDNVPEAAPRGSRLSLDTYAPPSRAVTVLLTRRKKWEWPRFDDLNVRELQPTSAVTLLTRRVPRRAVLSYGDWLAIARWVGCLPLALVLLNGALAAADGDTEDGGVDRRDDQEAAGRVPDVLDPEELLAQVRRPGTDVSVAFEPLSERRLADF